MNIRGALTLICVLMVLLVALVAYQIFGPFGKVTSRGYPYDNFDADTARFIEMLAEGGSDFSSSFIIREKGGDHNGRRLLECMWGNVTAARLVRSNYFRMVGRYWIAVEMKGGLRSEFVLSFVPNLGRVEVTFDWAGKEIWSSYPNYCPFGNPHQPD